jgi:hypothetical protein
MSKTITIPEFTKEQKRANLIKGIAALRRNKKKTRSKMRNSDGGRCCLCVLANSAERICGYKKGSFEGRGFPIVDLGKIFGVKSHISGQEFNLVIQGGKASVWNDGSSQKQEMTHKEIARMLKDEYLK